MQESYVWSLYFQGNMQGAFFTSEADSPVVRHVGIFGSSVVSKHSSEQKPQFLATCFPDLSFLVEHQNLPLRCFSSVQALYVLSRNVNGNRQATFFFGDPGSLVVLQLAENYF